MKYAVTSYNTQKLLSTTLKKIMREKDFAKISISEIADEAGLNRKTFYYHFKDTYELLAWTLEDEALKLVQSYDLTEDYAKVISFTLDYIETNSDFVTSVMHSYARGEIRKFLYNDLRDISIKTIDDIAKKKGVFIEDEYKRFVAGFSTEAIIGMIMHWVEDPQTFERAKLEKYLDRVFRVTVENLLVEESKH